MVRRKIRVYDFDGTCTVPTEAGEKAFLRAHAASLGQYLCRDLETVLAQYTEACARIAKNPDEYGWVMNGRIVAPALVDALVAAKVCAQIILREAGQDPARLEGVLDGFYQAHYLKYESIFRPELVPVFTAHRDADEPFYVVTNSDDKKVAKRFEALGDQAAWIRAQVIGHARKFSFAEEAPTDVPAHATFPGLARPILLRKPHYYGVLQQILATHGATWEDLVVIGDIAELDLAMPVELGAQGRLIVGPNTPAYEIAWAEAHPRVKVVRDLREAAA